MKRRSFIAGLFAAPAAVKAASVVQSAPVVPAKADATWPSDPFEQIVVIGDVVETAISGGRDAVLTIRFRDSSESLMCIACAFDKRSFKVLLVGGYWTFSAYVKAVTFSHRTDEPTDQEAVLAVTGGPVQYHPTVPINYTGVDEDYHRRLVREYAGSAERPAQAVR